MRELILAMSVSLDSFVSGPQGETEWIFSGDQDAIAWKLENAWNASLHIMGSRVFQSMAAFWPTSAGPFAPPMNQIPKAVFSKQGPAVLQAASTTLTNAQTRASATQNGQLQTGAETWAEAYVAGGELAHEIAGLKAKDGNRSWPMEAPLSRAASLPRTWSMNTSCWSIRSHWARACRSSRVCPRPEHSS